MAESNPANAPALHTNIESGKFEEKERPANPPPTKPKAEDDEEEDEDEDTGERQQPDGRRQRVGAAREGKPDGRVLGARVSLSPDA